MGTCLTTYTCDGPATGPLCGCDGKVVEGEFAECTLFQASSPYDNPAACQTGMFACGPTLQCKRNAQVCVKTLPGVPGPESYKCAQLRRREGHVPARHP